MHVKTAKFRHGPARVRHGSPTSTPAWDLGRVSGSAGRRGGGGSSEFDNFFSPSLPLPVNPALTPEFSGSKLALSRVFNKELGSCKKPP